jgi:hypothetical protein
VKRKIDLQPAWVQVTLERGEAPTDIIAVLSEAAYLARANSRNAMFVISGMDDKTDARALADALFALKSAGAPPPFKIAFFAVLYEAYELYHFAEQLAPKYGIEAKVFADVDAAKAWLGRP